MRFAEPRASDDEATSLGSEPTQVGATSSIRTPAGLVIPASLVTPPDDPYVGTIVSERYRVLGKLGEGGMGTVYLAEHIVIEKKVALKVLSEEFARKPDLVERFMQEAKAASRIGHENIVDITDFGQTASAPYIAMELLEGVDLATAIREGGPMPFSRVLPIAMQICRALSAAHGKGIVHRDMKPENIFLVTRDGRPDFVKVLDFGIAKMSSLDESSQRLTRTGMIFGTPEYMSPEQARGERADHRVDIYALGCILYEMLTSDVPFHAETFMGVLTKHMFEHPESIGARAGVSPEVEAVVMRALAKNRDERFSSMRELAQALAACASAEDSSAWGVESSGTFSAPHLADDTALPLPDASMPRARSALPIVAGGLALAAIVFGAVVLRPAKPSITQPAVAPIAVVKAADPPVIVEHSITVTVEPKAGPPADLWNGAERLGSIPGVIKMRHSTTPLQVVARREGAKDYAFAITPDSDLRQYRATFVEQPRHVVGGKRVVAAHSEVTRAPDEKPPESRPPAATPVVPSKKPVPVRSTGPVDLIDPFAPK